MCPLRAPLPPDAHRRWGYPQGSSPNHAMAAALEACLMAVMKRSTRSDAVKTVLSAVLVLALVPLSACAPKANDPADIQAVKQTVESYSKAVNAGDPEGVVAMMTDKTIYADNHFPVAVGKAAIQSMSAAQNSLFKTEFRAPVDEVRVAGDIAVHALNRLRGCIGLS